MASYAQYSETRRISRIRKSIYSLSNTLQTTLKNTAQVTSYIPFVIDRITLDQWHHDRNFSQKFDPLILIFFL